MVQWISHRGESIDAPENTASAFRLAMERDTDGMETDIHLTSDGVLVCCHDSDTKRTCNGKSRIIEQTSFSELETLDASNGKADWRGERLPTFAESLRILKPGKLYYVEIKENDPRVIPAMIAEINKAGVPREQIVMISFHAEIVRQYKAAYPDWKALWLTGFQKQPDGSFTPALDQVLKTLKEIRADGIDAHGNMEYIDAPFIRTVKEAGNLFAVWTIDTEDAARYFIDAGVDSITSNCAARLRDRIKGN